MDKSVLTRLFLVGLARAQFRRDEVRDGLWDLDTLDDVAEVVGELLLADISRCRKLPRKWVQRWYV